MQYNRGNYRSANTGLPVDPNQVDTRNYVQQTPNLRRVDLGQMSPLTLNLIDALVMQIQDNAERSALRTFAFNYWGNRQFTDPQFLELLQIFAAHVETISMMQNADPVQVIEGEAEFFVTAASAALVESFPEITEYLPPEAEGAITAAAKDWHGIVRDIKASQRQLGQGRSSYRGGMRGTQGNQPGGFNRQVNTGGGGMYGNHNQPDVSTLRPSWEMNRTVERQVETGPRSGFNSVQSTVRQQEPTVAAHLERVEVAKAKPGQPTMARPTYGTRAAPVNPRPLDKVQLDDGKVLIPAFLSGTTASHSPTAPPLVHDRNTHMLFHVYDPDGSVTESIQEKTPEMEYLAHELDEKLKKIYKVNLGVFSKERIEPNILLARKLIPSQAGTVATEVSEATRQKLDAMKAPRQLTKPFRAASMTLALFEARVEAARLPDESDLLEFQVEEVVRPDYIEGMLPHVLALRRCDSYAAFQETMYALHKDGKFDDDMFETLDKRITVAFNRYNSKQLYLGLVVDSFMVDFEALLDKVRQSKGDAVTAKFLAAARVVIGQACAVLTGESLSEFLKGVVGEANGVKEPACFCNRYSITQLPWTMYEMAHHWRLEGVVTPENAKPFHDALAAIFARTGTNGVREHLLLTSDEQVIYAYKSPIVEGNFNITKEPPVTITQFLEKAVD